MTQSSPEEKPSKGKRMPGGWEVDKRISLGTLVTIALAMLAGVAGWFDLSHGVKNNTAALQSAATAEQVAYLATQVIDHENEPCHDEMCEDRIRIKAEISRVKEERRRFQEAMKQLDRLEQSAKEQEKTNSRIENRLNWLIQRQYGRSGDIDPMLP